MLSVAKASTEKLVTNKKVSCSVMVISDVCGSGIVKIEFIKDDFVLYYGDVHCWFVDFTLRGKILNYKADHMGSAVTATLVSNQNKIDEQVGQLTYQKNIENKSSLATLVTKNLESLGGISSTYHMQCQNLPEDLNCNETCNSEDVDFVKCIRKCGNW